MLMTAPESVVNEPKYCRNCLYQLDAAEAGRCPECGREYDAGDATTILLQPRRPTRAFKRAAVVGAVLVLMGLLASVGSYGTSWRGETISTYVVVALFVIGGLVLFGCALLSLAHSQRTAMPPYERREARQHASFAFGMVVVVFVVVPCLYVLLSLL